MKTQKKVTNGKEPAYETSNLKTPKAKTDVDEKPMPKTKNKGEQ